jgi:transposase-like protein
MRESKTYDKDFKEKVIKEFQETGNLSEVARNNSIPVTTLRQWVINKNPQKKTPKVDKRELEKLQKELSQKNIEIEMLKELLKKTNRAWLKD